MKIEHELFMLCPVTSFNEINTILWLLEEDEKKQNKKIPPKFIVLIPLNEYETW